MKIDPDKPITCEAADDAVIVGPIGNDTFLVYSESTLNSWLVGSEGKSIVHSNTNYDVRNVPEITNEHWVAHYPYTIYGPYSTFRHCRTNNAGAQQYTRHWLEDGEPKCEVVKNAE